VSISYTTAPKLHQSHYVVYPYSEDVMISGARYSGVPHKL